MCDEVVVSLRRASMATSDFLIFLQNTDEFLIRVWRYQDTQAAFFVNGDAVER